MVSDSPLKKATSLYFESHCDFDENSVRGIGQVGWIAHALLHETAHVAAETAMLDSQAHVCVCVCVCDVQRAIVHCSQNMVCVYVCACVCMCVCRLMLWLVQSIQHC